MPKTIAAGETITIPAGRVAILPDLQVDGDLVIDGDLFIPTGSMTSQVVQKVASTDNAIVRFNGVTGEIQNSGVFVDDNGNVGIGTSTPATALDVVGTAPNSAGVVSVRPNGAGTLGAVQARNSSNATNYSHGQIVATADKITIDSSKSGTGAYLPLMLGIGGTYTFMIDTIGNSLHISPNGGLGYGTGAGGTVTQLTSKSTSVTLNKPTGQIITSNSSLAAGVTTAFILYNSLLTGNDNVKVIIGGAGAAGAYQADCTYCVNGGAANITVKNIDTVSRTDAVTISFTIIKGANS